MADESFASTGWDPFQPYTREADRTNPDYTVYVPAPDGEPRWHDDDFDVLNEHFIVVNTRETRLVAVWTAWGPGLDFLRVRTARSEDGGASWTEPSTLDGPGSGHQLSAKWAVPIVAPSGRVYCLYNKHTGITDCRRSHTGVMRCRYSDDDGRTWSDATTLPFRRSRHDHPNGEVPPNWIAWRQPAFDDDGRALVAFTRRASGAHDVAHDQVECMRFDNLPEDPEPAELDITWLPESGGVTVPGRGRDGSFAQESSIVPLPDGRLFKVMRTNHGAIWYTVSDDEGRTWRDTEPLRYVDDGEIVEQPVSPAPLYRLDDGRYLLLYNDNDGREPLFTPHRGESGPERFDTTTQNRRPAYVAVGEFRPEAYQPVWFSDPKLVVDNDAVPIDMVGTVPRFDAAAYTSLTEVDGERVLWYPDRKHFLLGKQVPDSFLADLQVPEG